MRIVIPIVLLSAFCHASDPAPTQTMTCTEILDEIKVLQKYKEQEERGNYEGIERVAAAILTRTVYVGDRRQEGEKVDISKEIAALKTKLPDCKPY